MSSLGAGNDEIWASLRGLRLNLVREHYAIGNEKWDSFYLHKMPRFDIDSFDLPDRNLKFIKEIRTVKREDTDLYYLLAVIKLALDDSRLAYDTEHNDVGLIISHENPGVEIFFEELVDSIRSMFDESKKKGKELSGLELARNLYHSGCEERGYNLQTFSYLFCAAKVFDLHGYSLYLNNACASGLFGIEAAARQIRDGGSPVVIVAAVDNPTKIYKYLWFKRQGMYAEDGITRPFSNDRSGVVFGDGGAALVLEDLEHARKRGAPIYAEYLGGGFSLEGWKITVPNVTEDYYARSFRKALRAARIKPEEIDFVNPHGVGMKVTDTYEAKTINAVFGRRRPPVSAFKPLIGHNLGGSALLETGLALLALKHGTIPATLNCENIDTRLGLNIVRDTTKADVRTVAKMSCGFAGFTGVTLFEKLEQKRRR